MKPQRDTDDTARVHAALAGMGAEAFVRRLGVEQVKRDGRGVRVPCPVHGGKGYNCAVAVRDGRLLWHCKSDCARGGDALELVAVVHGLNVKQDFVRVLELAAEIGNVQIDTKYNTRRGTTPAPRAKRVAPPKADPRYPPAKEVRALWDSCVPVCDVAVVSSYLEGRSIPPCDVETWDAARAIADDGWCPSWARYQGQTWNATGHRLLVPFYDCAGRMQSLRATRVLEGDSPKRLSPAGYDAAGLVMADPFGRLLLEQGCAPAWWPSSKPLDVVVCEGEPDWLTWVARTSDACETAPAVLGVLSGSWTAELAARVPDGARVVVRTDHDAPGEKYAERINETLAKRCTVLRSREA